MGRIGLINLVAICLTGCGGVEPHVDPVTISADPDTITRGDSTTLKWSAPGGVSVLDSSFGANRVTDDMTVSPINTTEYSITIRLASNDIFTAKTTVTVNDPPPPPTDSSAMRTKKPSVKE